MTTVLDALLASLQKAAEYNQNDTVPPAAVLWTDERREWERLVPRLRTLLPHFLVFGAYDKATRTGPAIWLRCVLAGKMPDITWAPGSVPIIYLPGVSRATLRATEECPNELKPLAELQYRGVFWSQVQRQGLDHHGVSPDEPRRPATQNRQGPGDGDSDSPSDRKLVDMPVARSAGEVGQRVN